MVNKKILMTALAVIAAPIAYYLASPLFINMFVSEKPSEGNVLLMGNFVNADDFHTAEGIAKIVASGGERVLTFQSFQARNGPDLFVYLASDRDVSKGFVDLGRLKGNIGDQNYHIPADTDLSKYKVAVIWCRAFSVPFGYSDLQK